MPTCPALSEEKRRARVRDLCHAIEEPSPGRTYAVENKEEREEQALLIHHLTAEKRKKKGEGVCNIVSIKKNYTGKRMIRKRGKGKKGGRSN